MHQRDFRTGFRDEPQYDSRDSRALAHALQRGDNRRVFDEIENVLSGPGAYQKIREANRLAGPNAAEKIGISRDGGVFLVDNYTGSPMQRIGSLRREPVDQFGNERLQYDRYAQPYDPYREQFREPPRPYPPSYGMAERPQTPFDFFANIAGFFGGRQWDQGPRYHQRHGGFDGGWQGGYDDGFDRHRFRPQHSNDFSLGGNGPGMAIAAIAGMFLGGGLSRNRHYHHHRRFM